MDTKERVRFDLDFLKTLFFFLLTALCAVLGYGIANFESISRIQMLLGYISSVVLAVALFFTILGLLISRKLLMEVR